MNLVARHETYFLQAIEEHGKCSHALREAKDRAFDAGLFLLSSKDVYEKERPGEWLTYAETFADKLPVRTGFLYRKFAEGMLLQAQEANPRLKDRTKLILLARQTVLDSALTFMELCRELGLVRAREGGGRRSENAPLRNEQFNFDFGILDDSLWALEKLGESALKEVPEKKLEETYTRLNTSLHMVRAELGRRPLHRLADPIRRWFWGTLSASGVSCFYYLADGDKLEAARADKAIQRVFPPFPAPSMAEATARLERMAPSRPISPKSQISNLKSEIPEEMDGARVETPQRPERDSLPLWCGFQNRSGLIGVFPKGYLPSFDTSWYECEPSSAFHAEDEAAALIIAAEKIFARLPENTPVDNSKKGAGPQGDRA